MQTVHAPVHRPSNNTGRPTTNQVAPAQLRDHDNDAKSSPNRPMSPRPRARYQTRLLTPGQHREVTQARSLVSSCPVVVSISREQVVTRVVTTRTKTKRSYKSLCADLNYSLLLPTPISSEVNKTRTVRESITFHATVALCPGLIRDPLRRQHKSFKGIIVLSRIE